MKDQPHNPGIELEARIVALVLGEASDFERDELHRLIEQRPELATLKEQLQSVHGLMKDVGAGESVAEDDDWKLSAEKRSAVLAVIRGQTQRQPPKPLINKPAQERTSMKENFLWNFAKIAAVFCVAGFFGSMARRPAVYSARESARIDQLASNEAKSPDSLDSSGSFFDEKSAPASGRFRMDGVGIVAADKKHFSAAESTVEEPLYEKNSKSALSAIRDSLAVDATLPSPHYLQDDVQSFPAAPDFELPREEAAPSEAREAQKQNHDESEIGDKSYDGLRRGFGVDATVPAEELRQNLSAEHRADEKGRRQLGARRKSGKWKETAPSRPMVAGIGGRAEKREAEEFLGDDVYGVKDFNTDKQSHSVRGPTNRPMASGGDLKEKGRLAEGFASESVTITNGADTALRGRLAQDGRSIFSGQAMSESGAAAAGQTQQDNGWAYAQNSNRDLGPGGKTTDQPAAIMGGTAIMGGDVRHERDKRAKRSLRELSALHKLDKNANMAGSPRRSGFVPPMLEDNSRSMKQAAANKSAVPAGLNEKTAEDEAYSTFSLHVSDVSFKLALSALARGEWPEAAKVRIEEFVNAFDYGDPMPRQNEKVACHVEQSIHPFLQQRNLLRVSMRTAAAGRSSNTPLRLTFLLDNSGSMERIDRQQTVRRAFALLAGQLKPIDQVTLISFARQPRLLADKVPGAQSHQLVELIDDLPSEGGTNLEAALQLALEKAREQQLNNAQNRIILLTDGAVNLGDANPASLSRMVTTMRGAGIAFDAAGISAEGLNDEILEALTRKGDGRYYLLDSLEAADDGFARQIAGALRPSAKNVKVQVEFNPKRVGRYKLLGFEKHRLKQEDFRNDKVDAAEMAAAEAGVAMYQFEAKPDGEGDVGSVSVRFRDLSTGQMIENRWPIPYQADAPHSDQAAPSLRIATSAALLAAKLRGEPLGETVDLKTLSDLISGLPDRDRNAKRVGQLQMMIGQARQMSGQ